MFGREDAICYVQEVVKTVEEANDGASLVIYEGLRARAVD